VLRALTDDRAFRVLAVGMTDTVRAAIAVQEVHGAAARICSDLLLAATLMRETMAPDLRVQAILQPRGRRSRMVADSHPKGATRGLVQQLADEPDAFTGPGVLEMMRSLQNGELQRGVVELDDVAGVGVALMRYMLTSEQVVSMVGIGAHVVGGELIAAGGYLVQPLPGVPRGALMIMAERLEDFRAIDHLIGPRFTPEELLAEILYGMPFSEVERSPVRYRCCCSQERLLLSLATLPRADLEELVAGGTAVEVRCDYCRRAYELAPEQLRALLTKN
jgi:molecular chaperone Hsp33